MDEDPKTTAFTNLYQLIEAGEALLSSGDLDGALVKYRQAARIVPGGSQMEEQIALTIQSILRAKRGPDSGRPAVVQRVPGSGFDTHIVTDPYQANYQPNPAQPDWGITPGWEKQPNQPPVTPAPQAAPVPPTYVLPQSPVYQPYPGPGSTVAMPGSPTPNAPFAGPSSTLYGAPASYPTQDPYDFAFDQAMEAISCADWLRAESLLAGLVIAQPYYTRNGVTAQDALAHTRNQIGQEVPQTTLKKWIIPALIGGSLALVFCALASAAGLFGYFIAKPPTPTPTLTTAPALATTNTPVIVVAPTYTLPPTYTALPTYTFQPTELPLPTATFTDAPPPTHPPEPTLPPAASCCTLRVRNRSNDSLWVGTSMPNGGNTIKPNWYLDFHLSGPQSVTVWYCDVRPDGSLVNCSSKTFNVSEALQEGRVP